jgi:hypothetical protein
LPDYPYDATSGTEYHCVAEDATNSVLVRLVML